MLSIGCLLFHKPLLGLPIFEIGLALLYFAAMLTLSSMISYLKAAWPMMSNKG
jgi:phosphatidylglycerophosphate synthase